MAQQTWISGNRRITMAKAKKSKKGKKAKKAKKAVAAKKSAKKSSKKAAKKSAKKSAKKAARRREEGREEIRQEGRGSAEEGCQEEPGEEKESGCAQAGAGPDGSSGAGARSRRPPRAGLPRVRSPRPRHGDPVRPTAVTRTSRLPRTSFRKAAASTAAAFFVRAARRAGAVDFTGRLIRKTRCPTAFSAAGFSGSTVVQRPRKPPKM